MPVSFAMQRCSRSSSGHNLSPRPADPPGGPDTPYPGCDSRPTPPKTIPANQAEKGRDAAQPAEPALAEASSARRALVDREIVEAYPGNRALPPAVDTQLEQGADARIEQRDHRTFQLDGETVCFVEERQASGTMVRGERLVDQLIESRRRPPLDVARAGAVEQHVDEVLGVWITGDPDAEGGMEGPRRSRHILEFDTIQFDFDANNLAPHIDQGRPVGGEVAPDDPDAHGTAMF